VFDFDSTLADAETIDTLAEACGQADLVRAITEQAMAGELDFFEALTERANLLKGLSYSRAQEICETLPLMKGASETVQTLKARGYTVVIFSGGFREATQHAAQQLGCDADFANFLHHKGGQLTGKVGGEMMTTNAKGDMLVRLQQLLGVSPAETVAVGDGANDRAMFMHSHTRVAFCAKDVLKQHASVCIDERDLRAVLEVIPR
jgi:phosphoserine phosphatase